MEKTSDVVIIGGFGHVGLPLGIVLADAGFHVRLLDIDTAKRKTIEEGKMPFIEYGAEPILQRVIHKTLHVCDSIEEVKDTRMIIITIGTPVDEYLSPKTRLLFQVADDIRPYLDSSQCVILRSTVFPGTSQALHDHWARAGIDVNLAYCPERIVQGYAVQELRELPQVISGTTPAAIGLAREIFEAIGSECVEVGLEEAEITKLFLNAWRYIQFAVANQFYMMATERGLRYEQIEKAMKHNYPRGQSLPRPGFAAGPCLLKDTMQLSAAFRNTFLLGHSAMMVNEGLASFIVDDVIRKTGPLHGKTIGILGMAFKADIDDTRDSLSYKLRKVLQFHGATVLCSDPFVHDPSFISADELCKRCSTVFVGVPHSAYRELSVPSTCDIVDVWQILNLPLNTPS